MNTIAEKPDDLNSLLSPGHLLEAFEKHYHDEVVMQENTSSPSIAKNANRLREKEFLNSIVEFRTARVMDTAVSNNVSFVKWHFDYTYKDWGVRNYTQVSVQHWKDGKIINEQFFYGN
ncbi:SnoaL-like domain-containing protein [Terrimonas alba]|uniref:SnoaL-like domain-containing protein n=1 Tax=Terrimonas alba TaxID=3349636 RepID=UPI0035F285D6